ncbi:MAG: hypothetical protein UW30_C0010G0030 [Candidatus Giovannonibacteria bacterium GW2011_GWA2_44_13b]|uniref:Uncharacterized protein n=2 Tax=Candidatus Giovannoniibacteriota TaxID=1752738 RepID=A0A0G1K0G5_9BACT|nr:MAG: hypothetical protein UW30_C0010G0030 [Candidatus Giovannonibacteria bacterium GW2011_GWA2_44_13b]OGF83068.1 MAG: hypothetical protein A2924_02075 [Candidatus Giovannonibacteria bacterium RIFCSPLOWO2_01_FULL_44_16]
MNITAKHIIWENSTFFVAGLLGLFIASWADFTDSQSLIIALIVGYIFYSFMVLRRGIARANKFLSYKTEILILPKWGNLIELGNKHFKIKNVFHKIRDKIEKDLGVKFGESGFGIPEFKWAIEVKQGAEKIPNAFITKGGARFITQPGLIWSDLQKTFFIELGFNEQIFGGYGGSEPYLWMEITKPKFMVGDKELPKHEWEMGKLKEGELEEVQSKIKSEGMKLNKGGMLKFFWGGEVGFGDESQDKEICTFPLRAYPNNPIPVILEE